MLAVVNSVRSAYSLPRVRVAPKLHQAALLHSHNMATHGYLGHISPSGVGVKRRLLGSGFLRGWGWWIGGETLARGYATAADVVYAWLASPPHRRILLARWPRWVGIGRAYHNGVPYWTMEWVRRW